MLPLSTSSHPEQSSLLSWRLIRLWVARCICPVKRSLLPSTPASHRLTVSRRQRQIKLSGQTRAGCHRDSSQTPQISPGGFFLQRRAYS
ncbi:hypothetical protein FKM82_005509 [Ascaphus truei]